MDLLAGQTQLTVINEYFAQAPPSPSQTLARRPLDPLLFLRARSQDGSTSQTEDDQPDESPVGDQAVCASGAARELLRRARKKLGQKHRQILNFFYEDKEAPRATPCHCVELPEDESVHERWLAMLEGRSAAEVPEEKLRLLVDTGTPLKQRHQLWPRWWNRGKVKADAIDIGELLKSVPDEFARTIEVDVCRTVPELLKDGDIDTLRRVLSAYAAHNQLIGYCQGMSFIAAVPLVLGFSEMQAFLCLSFVVEDICPGYHGPGLEGYLCDLSVLSALTSFMLPEIFAQLESLQISLDMLGRDHLLTLGSRTWPLAAIARLWDVVLMEGSEALLASFLALLQMYFPSAVEPEQAKTTDEEDNLPAADCVMRFREMTRVCIANDIDELIHQTRVFLPMVRGDPAPSESQGKGTFLDWLRVEVACAH